MEEREVMKTKLEINNRLNELSEETQLGITRFINSMASHSFSSDEILEELNNVNDKLVNKWCLEQQHRIMTDRYNFVVDLLNEKQSKELRQYLIDTGAICDE